MPWESYHHKWAPLKWDIISVKRICGFIHKFSRSIDLLSKTFCLISDCVKRILVHIYLPWPKVHNGSSGIHVNVACLADYGYGIFSALSLLRPFTVHYYNIQSRRNLFICATNERDYKQQHWIEMLALSKQNTIMPLSDILHWVRWYYDFFLNIGCVAIEKRVKQKFSTWILLLVIAKLVRPYLNCW